MNLLITCAGSELARMLAQRLDEQYSRRLTDRRADEPEGVFAVAALGHDASTDLLVQGIDGIVLVGEPDPDESGQAYLDLMTRCTYNLLTAASRAGVKRVVYLSTLHLMTGYGPEFYVTERWRPRPSPEPYLLGKFLGESVCREFARERRLKVVALRVGTPMLDGHAESHPLSLAPAELVSAVEKALTVDTPQPWTVIHVQGEYPGARFAVGDAKRLLGWEPSRADVARQAGAA